MFVCVTDVHMPVRVRPGPSGHDTSSPEHNSLWSGEGAPDHSRSTHSSARVGGLDGGARRLPPGTPGVADRTGQPARQAPSSPSRSPATAVARPTRSTARHSGPTWSGCSAAAGIRPCAAAMAPVVSWGVGAVGAAAWSMRDGSRMAASPPCISRSPINTSGSSMRTRTQVRSPALPVLDARTKPIVPGAGRSGRQPQIINARTTPDHGTNASDCWVWGYCVLMCATRYRLAQHRPTPRD